MSVSARISAPLIPRELLVKQNLADHLRAAIVNGTLQPGERIVEATWARRFGAAQASIREAIHILASEGFVTKASGRSARVVHLTESDVLHLYEIRGALEGLAARLAANRRAPTGDLQEALNMMRLAAREDRCGDLVDADLRFHLELCRASGNPFLNTQARRILLPFFAFVRMRITVSGQGASAWDRDRETHQRIIDLIDDGEGEVVEQYIKRAMARFSVNAYDIWEKRIVPAPQLPA